MQKNQRKKQNSYGLVLVVALLVLLALTVVISGVDSGKAIARAQIESHDDIALAALCGTIPLTSNVLKLARYSSVGDLRQALVLADLSSTLPLPIACVFDCGVRVLPARNDADFAELMGATNFGQTLSAYSCKLPVVPVTNLKGEKLRLA